MVRFIHPRDRSQTRAGRGLAFALLATLCASGCGDERASTTSTAATSSGAGGAGGTAPVADPCSPFVGSVVSVDYGPGAGFGQDRFPAIVMGPPKGAGDATGSLDVLSLGNGGTITLAFGDQTIVDLAGPDFIVFENAFYAGGDPSSPFAELATVEVSEDGTTWTAFPCTATTPPYGSCAGWHPVYADPDSNDIDPRDPGVAGGDAFDLADLGVAKARFVRITDRADQVGLAGSFDLDAIAIVRDAAGSHSSCAGP